MQYISYFDNLKNQELSTLASHEEFRFNPLEQGLVANLLSMAFDPLILDVLLRNLKWGFIYQFRQAFSIKRMLG